MAKLKVVKVGDDILRKKCRPVEEITPKILQLLDDMTETMIKEEGCGLAAPQVGILKRIAVVKTEENGPLYELINPKIIAYSGTQTDFEGCLSVPGKRGTVTRPMHITVRALDRNGVEKDINCSEFLARAMCHEIDHLDGIIYTDKATNIERIKND